MVVYVYPANGNLNPMHKFNGKRFADTYESFPAEYDHQVLVVSNGEEPSGRTQRVFGKCQNLTFMVHDNSGWDIGAFQHAARNFPDTELMVFFGNSGYLRGPGWLKRMVEVAEQQPNTLWGSMVHGGFIPGGIWPHVRTTGFWMSANLLLQYPILVTDPGQRYPFEHGPNCLTMWCAQNGHGVMCATFNAVYDMNHFGSIPDGYHNGTQSQMITGDRCSCPPFYPFS